MIDDLLTDPGYIESPFYHESTEDSDVSVAHLLPDARRAHGRGSYFIRTAGGDTVPSRARPAVYVAEANTPDEARQMLRQL
jgi:hypothetical protein